MRGLPVLGYPHPALAGIKQVFEQGETDMPQRVHPAPFHQHQIALVRPTPATIRAAFAEHVVQRDERRAFLADQEQPRGLTIQTMREFEKTCLRPLSAQRLDHPEADPAAAMHGKPRRFIDHQQRLVLMNNRQCGLDFGSGDDAFLPLGDADRRNPQHITNLQTAGDLGALAIHPHLAAAHNAVNMAFRHALAASEQVIIQTLPLLIFGDNGLTDGFFACLGHFEIY